MILPVASTPKSAVMRASSISSRVASSSFRKTEKIFLSGAVKTSLVLASPCLNFSMKPPKSPMARISPQRQEEHKGKPAEARPEPGLFLLLAGRGGAEADVVEDAVDEGTGILGRELLGDVDRFVDRD